jgi:trimeric autotransporter adhesin
MQRWTSVRRFPLLAWLLVLATACESALDTSHAPVDRLIIDREVAELEVESQLRLQVTILGANGEDLQGKLVFWSSENQQVASVNQEGVVSGVAPGTTRIAASSEGRSALATVHVVAVPVTSVEVSPSNVTIDPGAAETLQARVRDARGRTVTDRTVNWTSDAPDVVSVNGSGRITAHRPGRAEITATVNGVRGTASVRVRPGRAARLDVVSGNGQQVTARTLLPLPLVVRVLDASGFPVPDATVSWRVDLGGGSLSNTSSTTDGEGDATTRLTAGPPGDQRVTASLEQLSAAFSASALAIPVHRIVVAPATITVPIGTSGRLEAELFDAGGGVITGRTVEWTSSSAAVVRVSPTGVLTPVGLGTATVTAAADGVQGTATVQVTRGAPANLLVVSGSGQTGLPGERLNQPLVVQVSDAAGNSLPDVLVQWTVTQGGGSVSPTSVRSNGQGRASTNLTLGSAGENRVRASVGGITATFTATARAPAAVATVTVSPSSVVLEVGATRQMDAVLRDSSGAVLTGRTVAWTSGDTAIARVSASGLVTAVRPGSAQITATAEGVAGSASARVDPGPPAAVDAVSGGGQQGTTGSTLPDPLVVRVVDAAGFPVAGVTVQWTVLEGGGSVSPTSAQTGTDGRASTQLTLGGSAGENRVRASAGSLTATFSATAVQAHVPVATVEVTPATLDLAPTETGQLQAVLRAADGSVLTGRDITWSSGAPTVAQVDGSGRVTAALPGTAQITATSEGVSGSATVRVAVGGPANLQIVSGDNQTGARRSALPAPLVVRVTDAQGFPVPGVTVAWSVASGGGSVSPATSLTGPTGEASTSFTLGQGLGNQGVSAAVGSLVVQFNAMAVAADELAADGPLAATRESGR